MLSKETLKKLQAVLLEMLIEVDRICRKNNIEYSLSGGTLLGAVRHGGFIPWDDDVDVSMRRVDYEKFKRACKRDLDKSRFFFQDHTTDPNYRWGYARLRRKDSVFIRTGQEHMKQKTGIFLDIFPNDYVPDFLPFKLLHTAACFGIRKVLYSESGKVSEDSAVKRAVYSLLNLIPKETAFAVYNQLTKLPKSGYCRALTFPTPKNNYNYGNPSHFYDSYTDIKFEGYTFRAMKFYHAYLEYKYGDYMQLPPKEQQVNHHEVLKLKFPKEFG